MGQLYRPCALDGPLLFWLSPEKFRNSFLNGPIFQVGMIIQVSTVPNCTQKYKSECEQGH
jgi:hypothetical protein